MTMTAALVTLSLANMVAAENERTPLDIIREMLMPVPPSFPTEDYDGWQYRYGRFVFRPKMFMVEGILLSFVLVYIGNYLFVQWRNARKADKWFNAHYDLLSTQFSRPGEKGGFLSDGASDLFQFSTGRRNVQSLHSIFTFLPHHDFFQAIFTYGWILYDLRYNPSDDVTLDFKLGTKGSPPQGAGYVWAIVEKNELINIKGGRWDLTLTKAHDNANVPQSCVVMTEVADVSDTILKSNAAAPLLAALKDPQVGRYFKSLSITDQPFARPTNGPIEPQKKERHLILSLKVPSSSHIADTVPLVKAVFGLIDFIEGPKFALRAETIKKLKVSRDELDKDLRKDITEEKAKEAEDAKRSAKKKAEEERIAKLSAEQQRKAMEKEKKRALRRGTQKVRMG